MSRTVESPSDAAFKTFFVWNIEPEDYDISEILWRELVDDIQTSLKAKFKSLENDDEFCGRESKVILRNAFCVVIISEYCGLVALSVVPLLREHPGLSIHWTGQMEDGFFMALEHHELLSHRGTFSNGEGIYAPRGKPMVLENSVSSKEGRLADVVG